jgi:hypothetical protein
VSLVRQYVAPRLEWIGPARPALVGVLKFDLGASEIAVTSRRYTPRVIARRKVWRERHQHALSNIIWVNIDLSVGAKGPYLREILATAMALCLTLSVTQIDLKKGPKIRVSAVQFHPGHSKSNMSARFRILGVRH